MRRPALVWGSTLGTLALFDLWCARNKVVGDSLSEITRAALKTDTRAGSAAFVIGWGALTAWLIPHICRAVHDATT